MSDDLIAPHLPMNHPQNVERRLRDEIERLRAEVKRLDAGWREAVEVANSYAEQFGVHERERDALRARAERAEGRIASAPIAIMDTRDALGLCAPTEEDFPSLYALQGKTVALVVVND